MTEIKGKHVLLGILGFFGAVFAVNGAFVFFALDSWSGLDIDDPYARGLHYREEVEQARHWDVRVGSEQTGPEAVRLMVELANTDGVALRGLGVTAEIRRPTVDTLDQTVHLAFDGRNMFSADVALPAAGQWDVRVRARRDGQLLVRADKRLWIKP